MTASGDDAAALGRALTSALVDVARQMVADGEGSSRFAHYVVSGAADDGEARTAVRQSERTSSCAARCMAPTPTGAACWRARGTCGVGAGPRAHRRLGGRPRSSSPGASRWAGARSAARGSALEQGRGGDPDRPPRPAPEAPALRLLALARVRDVQCGVLHVSRLVVVKLGGNAALESVPGGRGALHASRASASCTAAGAQITAVGRVHAASSRASSAAGASPIGEMLACVREGLGAVSDELCAALAGRRAGSARIRRRRRRGAPRRPSWDSWASPQACATGEISAALGKGLVPVIAPLGDRRRGLGPQHQRRRRGGRDRHGARGGRARLPLGRAGCARRAGRRALTGSRPRALRPSASGGMLPKLEACTTALLGGVGARQHRHRRYRGDAVSLHGSRRSRAVADLSRTAARARARRRQDGLG